MSKTRYDWLGWAATAFALVVTFSAEYELALAVGIHHLVALAVPGALDVYVLRALQVRRDVFLTVLAMILVNAASHLVTAGVLAVKWPLIVAVSAIAPLVLWRSHVLGGFTRNVPPVPENVPTVSQYTQPPFLGTAPVLTVDEHAAEVQEIVNPGTVNVPENAFPDPDQDEWPEYDWPFSAAAPVRKERTPVLSIVPPVDPGVLIDGDKEFIDEARNFEREYGGVPPIRALKMHLSVGADRARRLKLYLEAENADGNKEGTS